MSIQIDYELCKKDGICAAVCPAKLFTLAEDKTPSLVDNSADMCISCGHCLACCPPGAITVNGVGAKDVKLVNKNIWPMYENISHLLQSRRSVRAYKNSPVEKETITELLDTVRYAPTGSNSQATQWIVINKPEKIQELNELVIAWFKECITNDHPLAERLPMAGMIAAWENGEDMIMRGAPAIIINHAAEASGLPSENCAIAMTYLELAAATKALGTCWAGFIMLAVSQSETIKKALKIPEENRVGSALMLGYSKFQYLRIPQRNQLSVNWW